MKMSRKRSFVVCAAMLACLSLLAGCAAPAPAQPTPEQPAAVTTAPAQATPDSTAPTQSDTVTVQDVRGAVEIPAQPQRIVDLSGNSDILHILGYSVIGTANSDAYDYTKLPSFLEDVLADAKILGFAYQDTMDIENILPLEPDLIILSTRQEKMYDQLREIAPTVMIELAQINWQDDLMTLAGIFNKTEQAQQWLDEYLAKAAQTGEQIRSTYGEQTTYFSFLASGGQLFVFDAAGIGSIFYNEMGLGKPSGMPEQADVSLPVITYEGLAAIEADYVFVLGTQEDMATLNESPIWKSLPAVEQGRVVELPVSPYFNQAYSPIGRSLFVDEVIGLMEQVQK